MSTAKGMILSERTREISMFQSVMIDDIALEMIRRGDDVIMVGTNCPIGEAYAHVRDAGKKALDEGYTKYGPSTGLYEFREAAAKRLRQDGLNVDPEKEILVTNGSEEAIFIAIQTLVNKGDEVMQSQPSYPYDYHVTYAGGTIVEYPLSEGEHWRLDSRELESRVTEKTKLITLVDPHSPTGRVFTRDELEGIAQVATKHDLLLLVDHVNADLIYDGTKHVKIATLPGMKERTIMVNSFSKSHPGMAGWRVGYAVGPSEIIKKMAALHVLISNMGGCTFAQKGAAAIYNGPQEPLKATVRRFQDQRNRIVKRLNEIKGVSCHSPQAGAHCFPNFSAYGTSSMDLAIRLLKDAKIVVHPGITYHIEHYARFNHTHPRAEEALDRMEGALKKFEG